MLRYNFKYSILNVLTVVDKAYTFIFIILKKAYV